ncbi:MAG: AraC family transcriptional regulator [Gemmatimonadaceae bacterium]|jgi:AraC family transcriptional regulator|nr:AraC family transcriptional regulator [Gemmatimonadaceae bacterium]
MIKDSDPLNDAANDPTPATAAATPWVERILRVMDHVQAHLDDDLTPDTLASLAGFSLHHFHRVFRGMVGQSVMEYVRDRRLERAAFRLKFGTATVTQVAFDSGYGSHEAFTRAFRARFAMPPSAYREQALAQREGDVDVTLRQEPEQPVLCWRHVGAYDGASETWTALLGFAGQHGLFGPHTRILGFVYDDPEIVPADRLRYDAALTLSPTQAAALAAVSLPRGARLAVFPAGHYALTLHIGPYDQSDVAYVRLLGQVLPRRGVELASDAIIEVYLNSPMDTPPEALRTEILVRLTP